LKAQLQVNVEAARGPTGSESPGSQQPVRLGADLRKVQRMLGEMGMRNATGAAARGGEGVALTYTFAQLVESFKLLSISCKVILGEIPT